MTTHPAFLDKDDIDFFDAIETRGIEEETVCELEVKNLQTVVGYFEEFARHKEEGRRHATDAQRTRRSSPRSAPTSRPTRRRTRSGWT